MDQIQVQLSQKFELFFVTIPECVVAATPFFVADNRFHTTGIQDFQNILRAPDGTRIDIPKDHIKIRSAPDKVEDFPFIFSPAGLNPERTVLSDVPCLYRHDGLKHPIVGRYASEAQGMRFIAHKPDKLRKIDVGRTPDTALGAGEAIPYGFV
jgi:hypothetical protein